MYENILKRINHVTGLDVFCAILILFGLFQDWSFDFKICSNCIKNLEEAYEFTQLCISSYTSFKNTNQTNSDNVCNLSVESYNQEDDDDDSRTDEDCEQDIKVEEISLSTHFIEDPIKSEINSINYKEELTSASDQESSTLSKL